jgi:hypothetical protein
MLKSAPNCQKIPPNNPRPVGSGTHEMRLNYLAIGQKNEIFLFLFSQPLTDFTLQKNSRFSHQTRKFVLYRGGERHRPAGHPYRVKRYCLKAAK